MVIEFCVDINVIYFLYVVEILCEWICNNIYVLYFFILLYMCIDFFYEYNIIIVLILFLYIGLIKDIFILYDRYIVDLY